MKTIAEMSPKQFEELLDEYYAPAAKRHKMTEGEVKKLAKKLNKKINVPLIRETKEEKILIKVVMKIDTFLYDNLPNEFYELVRSVDNGIDDNEAKRLIKRLSKLANKHIDIPYIPEEMEYIAIRFIIGIIINAARKKWNIDLAEENIEQIKIPSSKKANDSELEAIIISV